MAEGSMVAFAFSVILHGCERERRHGTDFDLHKGEYTRGSTASRKPVSYDSTGFKLELADDHLN